MFARIAVIGTLMVVLFCPLPTPGQGKGESLDEKGVLTLLELGFDDETTVERIKETGLTFEVTDQFVEKLKTVKASKAVITAIQEASKAPTGPAGTREANPPITFDQVLQILSLRMKEEKVLQRIAKAPPVFVLSVAQEEELVKAGATPKVIAALKGDRPPPVAAEAITNVALVLDCSGSMKEKTKEGVTKMEAAKKVLADLIKKMPEGLNVTFVIYGHEVYGGADDPRNCQAVKVVRSLGKLDGTGKLELGAVVAGLKPTGGTPIALALKKTGEELAKDKESACGIVLLTDGLESCKGDPTAEAAALVKNLKVSFGVNVVGLGVDADADDALKGLAEAGGGKYYNADDATSLADSFSEITKELEVKSKPADKKTTMRRAIIVSKPAIDEFPPVGEIQLISRGLGTTSVDGKGGYGEEIRVPSATSKYDVYWVPKDKDRDPVPILRGQVFSERKLVEIKPEEHLGMIRINGKGQPKKTIEISRPSNLGSVDVATRSKKFGQVLVVPAGKWNIFVDDNKIEEDFEVAPGKLHDLE